MGLFLLVGFCGPRWTPSAVRLLGRGASDREAHRAAVDWLNANMNDAFNFFAVEVEAWEIGASRPSGRVALSPS
jgi:hypothetical protein